MRWILIIMVLLIGAGCATSPKPKPQLGKEAWPELYELDDETKWEVWDYV